MVLFTAGLERQAAKIFELNAHYITDKRAKQIFELFAIDENRHAEAEIRLARRLGVRWKDLPLATPGSCSGKCASSSRAPAGSFTR